jgi:Asp-tRNA(Asn)/Glu-tRNA(Gln) amidotransferase A subunit family amidase
MYFKPSSLTNLSIALRNNILQPDKYITDTCNRITEVEKELHALIPEKGLKKRLTTQMREILEKYPKPSDRPALFGVLVGIDDMFRVDGFSTLAGSELPAKEFAGKEAVAVTLLKEAGAIVLGKTACTEFSYTKPGKTTNPHNPEFSPGGSSSGAAAAVGAGLCPLALGIQVTASIIRSASYCGIVGFKPGYGRIPTAGTIPFAGSVEQVGFFTQDITSAALAASILVKDWDSDVRATSRPKICLPSDAYLVQAQYDVYNHFYRKIDILTRNGFEVVSYPLLKDIRDVNTVHRELIAAEFAQAHKRLYADYGDFYSPQSRELFERGSKIKKATLMADKAIQQTLRDSINEVMRREGIDLWICPSTVTSAPRGLESTGNPLMSLPWTFAGLPSISIPSGSSAHNLPVGIQIVAGIGRDERLLQHAAELYQLIGY